jgi:peptide-methionine (R)-S-oxide reductase
MRDNPHTTTMKPLALTALILAADIVLYAADKPAATSDDSGSNTAATPTPKAMETKTDKVVKTDEEWRKILTPEQYRVMRQAGTEAPNGAKYSEFNKQGEGTYFCASCGAELFTSNEKFHSGCGWPSFYDQSKAKGVAEHRDPDGRRIEVVCKKCDAHLGHVFEKEGFNTPTDRRFCINAESLKFVPGTAPATTDAKPKATEPAKK